MESKDLRSALRRTGLRVTSGRLSVLATLATSRAPMSIRDLERQNRGIAVDTVTLYRMMDDFVAAGFARRVDFGQGHARFEWNDPEDHHHHLVCEDCGQVQDVRIELEDRILSQLRRRFQFRTSHHTVEFFGLCANCQ